VENYKLAMQRQQESIELQKQNAAFVPYRHEWRHSEEGKLVQIFFEEATRLRVAQLADGALFDLAHALTSDLELAANLFQRVVVVVHQAKA